MREASIHIKEKDLTRVLDEILNSKEGNPISWDTKNLAKDILTRGRKYSLTKRLILVSSKKVAQKTERVVLSDIDDAELFSKLLITVRKQLKHRGINIIKVGSKDWGQIKEVTKLAIDFCNEFQLGKREGFIEYIKIGLGKMTRFGIIKFNSMQQTICEHYAAIQDINEDPTPRLTEKMHDIYNQLLVDKTGYGYDYKKQPEKYVYFIKAKDEATKHNVGVDIYIKAQYAGLSFASGVPDPLQLVGPKAEERLRKYMYTNNITAQKEVKSEVDWNYVLGKKSKKK